MAPRTKHNRNSRNNRKPLTARQPRALEDAKALKEMVEDGLRVQGVDPKSFGSNHWYVKAATLVNFLTDFGEDIKNPVVASGAGTKSKKSKPKAPKAKKFLKHGQKAYGVIVKDPERGFTFVEPTHVITDGNDVSPIARHQQIFLHVNQIDDLVFKEAVTKGDTVTFIVEPGSEKGQLTATEVIEASIQKEVQVDPDAPFAGLADMATDADAPASAEEPVMAE